MKGGACSRDRSPSAKKRKSNKGDKAGALTMEDIIAGIATYKTQAERRVSLESGGIGDHEPS